MRALTAPLTIQTLPLIIRASHADPASPPLPTESDLFYDNRHTTWLGNTEIGGKPLCWGHDAIPLYGGPSTAVTNRPVGAPDVSVMHGGSVCQGAGPLYMTSVYWAVMTITSIGCEW